MAEYHTRGIVTLLPEEWQSFMKWPLYLIYRVPKPVYCQILPPLKIAEIEEIV